MAQRKKKPQRPSASKGPRAPKAGRRSERRKNAPAAGASPRKAGPLPPTAVEQGQKKAEEMIDRSGGPERRPQAPVESSGPGEREGEGAGEAQGPSESPAEPPAPPETPGGREAAGRQEDSDQPRGPEGPSQRAYPDEGWGPEPGSAWGDPERRDKNISPAIGDVPRPTGGEVRGDPDDVPKPTPEERAVRERPRPPAEPPGTPPTPA
jgi:hypothetical protein